MSLDVASSPDESAPTDRSGDDLDRAMRWALVGAQGFTLYLTWPLWQVRTSPPNLPLVPWLSGGDWPIDFTWLMLASLAIVLVRPAIGVVLHLATLLLAIMADQLRIQPEFVSIGLLMLGTSWGASGKILARWHLIALWFFAGLHKLLSDDYWNESGPEHFLRLMPEISRTTALWLAGGVAVWELSQGILTLVYPLRRFAGISAIALHSMILCGMMASNWNSAIWPWNITLALTGFLLLPQAIVVQPGNYRPLVAHGVGFAMFVAPCLFYVGKLDPYLAHCLYSDNTPQACFYNAEGDGEYLSTTTMNALNVPFPPAHRMFEQYFDRVAQPGDSMTILDDRSWAKSAGLDDRVLYYAAPGEPRRESRGSPPLEEFAPLGLEPHEPLSMPGALDNVAPEPQPE